MKRASARLATLTILLVVAVFAWSVMPAQAARRDRQRPTTPTNLRVTGMTAYSVSLAWDPSSDNSGSFSYTVCCSNVHSETFPGPASTHVYRAGLQAGYTFTLRIVAHDAAGNYSSYSNDVTFTLPRDTTPPTQPTVAVTDVGPTHVSLAWSATDDGPRVWYTVRMNGSPVLSGSESTSGAFGPLQPETTYTFTVQARDAVNQLSPVSETITVTTEARDTSDTIPPTTPGDLGDRGMSFEDGETWLFWTRSTDNVDPQSIIRYDIYVNGVFDHSLMGGDRTIVYGNPGVFNTYTVIAVDSAGNQSGPASITTCAGAICQP
jgi:chitodextrinase